MLPDSHGERSEGRHRSPSIPASVDVFPAQPANSLILALESTAVSAMVRTGSGSAASTARICSAERATFGRTGQGAGISARPAGLSPLATRSFLARVQMALITLRICRAVAGAMPFSMALEITVSTSSTSRMASRFSPRTGPIQH
jgi:hypothetical protein